MFRFRCVLLLVVVALVATAACQIPSATQTTTAARPTPVEEIFDGCPGQGRGPDSQLNLLKNRVDEGAWQPTAVANLLQLTWPPGIAGKRMSAWAPGDRATRSLIIEFTPRIRAKHPTWTLRALELVVREKTRVRISGWTMFDPDHPEEVGKSRGTLWEIHPVMRFETGQPGGAWKEV